MISTAFRTPSKQNNPLIRINTNPIFDEILEKQPNAAHSEEQKPPIDEPRIIREFRRPCE